jgi:hypothetical protein
VSSTNIEPLSYSSSNELLGCQQKYVYRKVQKVDIDEDAPRDTLALDMGKAIHQCLEECMHDLRGFPAEKVKDRMEGYNVPADKFDLIFTMLGAYRDLHEEVGLKCVACEVKLEAGDFIGYIDALLQDEDGGLWICDVKTAARANQFLPSKLPMDRQLNLYAHEYGVEKIKGCKYRVIYKTKKAKAVEYTIPLEVMRPKEIAEDFKKLRKLQTQLFRGTKKPIRNFGNCDSYFRPCEYWSKCHGAQYSNSLRVTEISV